MKHIKSCVETKLNFRAIISTEFVIAGELRIVCKLFKLSAFIPFWELAFNILMIAQLQMYIGF